MRERLVMIIRHAEKAADPEPYQGVDDHGNHDQHSLTIRGWQRAGALVHLFADEKRARHSGLTVPAALFACAVTAQHPSKRCEQTLMPLSLRLAIPLRLGFSKDHEDAVAATVAAMHEDVLLCWEHKNIPALARALAPRRTDEIPQLWPDDCFDQVWVLRSHAGEWEPHFGQIAQLVLAGDSPEPVKS